MIPARQSTALEIAVGPVLDADGVAVTDCVVGDFKIKKTTGNFGSLNGSATLTHVSAGVYDLVLTASDTDTVGLCTIAIDDGVNACQSIYLQVMEEAVYDRDYAASATGYIANAPVNVAQFGGINGTFSGGRPEVNTTLIEGSDATNQIRDAVVDDATRIDASALNTLSSHDPGETIMGATDLGTGSGLTSLATAAELAKVPKSDGTATWNATALASINAQCATALADYDGPTNAEMVARTLAAADYATSAAQTTAQNNLDIITGTDGVTLATSQPNYAPATSAQAIAIQGATFDPSTDSLEAIRNRGDAAWVTATGFSTLDAAGVRAAVGLASANLDTQLADLPTVAEFEARTLPSADYFVVGDYTAPPSAATIADAVWDEAIAGHAGAGSTGEALSAAGAAGDPWITTLPGSYTAGQAGYILGTNLNATVSSRSSHTAEDVRTEMDSNSTQLAAIVADTNELQTNQGNWLTATGFSTHSAADVVTALGTGSSLTALATQSSVNTLAGYVDTEVAAIKAKTDNLPSDPAGQSAVEAAILAAWTTALTESYNADGSPPTPAQALFLIMQRLTEFAISGTTITVKKLDGTTAATLTLDDATNPTSSTRAS